MPRPPFVFLDFRHLVYTLALLCGLNSVACNAQANSTGPAASASRGTGEAFAKTRPAEVPYDFAKPVADFKLPKSLKEISGLTLLDEDHLGAVQDEKGNLYILNARTGVVEQKLDFGGKGDYEGIELAGERLFVLRSDGELLELLGWRTGRPLAREYDGKLGRKKCNAEGLGADGQRLLIVCKEDGKDDRNEVHAFDLASNSFSEDAVFEIDRDDVAGERDLRPSAIARHPVTGELIVLSSRRQRLIVLDPAGSYLTDWDISAAELVQPEGLTFFPNGDLLLSSEGRKGAGRILKFEYRG